MKLSFCISCMNRFKQIKQTLPKNLNDNYEDKESVEFILVDFNSNDGLYDFVLENFKSQIEEGYLKFYFTKELTSWHASIAKNTSHVLSESDIIVTLDADNFTGVRGGKVILEQFEKIGRNHLIHQFSGTFNKGDFGRICFFREDFLKAGGYDETFMPMAYQDSDMIQRLNKLKVKTKEFRNKEFNKCITNTKADSIVNCNSSKSWEEMLTINCNRSKYRIENKIYVANKGKKIGVDVVRIFETGENEKKIDVDDVRIFETGENEKNMKNKMRLLVTGGYGFIGSHFINKYFSKVDFLVNIDAMYYCAKETNVNESVRRSPSYIYVQGNCNNFELMQTVLKTYNISHIIHFAAQSHVQNSFTESLKYTKDNIMGTHVLLECARLYGKIEKIVHVSTDEVYGESLLEATEKMTEQSILSPTNPYAATKAGAELIVQSYQYSYKMPIIITRGNNVYGPNQYPEKLIPRFIELLKNDKKVTIQGNGSCMRGFLHVDDTVNAYIKVLENGNLGEIYNIGCDSSMEYSVLEISKFLIKLVKKTSNFDKWIKYIEDRPFNDKRYFIDNKKIKDLGWKPEINLENGLKSLIFNKNNF